MLVVARMPKCSFSVACDRWELARGANVVSAPKPKKPVSSGVVVVVVVVWGKNYVQKFVSIDLRDELLENRRRGILDAHSIFFTGALLLYRK